MPTAVGPNTKGEENLVFGYDLGDVSNSYKGEPTENLITDTAAFDSSFWNQKSGTITANSVTGPRGIENAAKIVAVNTDPYIYSSAIVTASTGNVTWSIWVKGDGNTIGKSAQVRINFSGTATGTADTNASINLTSNWQLLQTTANVTGAGTIKFGLEAPNSAVSGDVMYFADPMFEQKSHATQFTAGTRSDIQGLLDLTGDTSIDISNVSFDSNAQPDWDGANDYIALSQDPKWYTNEWAYELVFKSDTNNGTYQGLIWAEGAVESGYSGYQKLLALYNHQYFHYRIGNSSTGWGNTNYTPSNLTPTNYNHIVWQFFNGVTNIAINGEIVHTDTSRGSYNAGSNSKLYLGTRNDLVYELNGQIPYLKRYSRLLTAEEIKANYNAIKGRFNI